jgi:hypothetical protein
MPRPEDVAQAPRIAIKFGGTSSATTKAGNGPHKRDRGNPSSALGKRQRSHAFGGDSDSSDDETRNGRHEAVTSFGEHGAENETKRSDTKSTKAEKPFVIGGHHNRDWRAEVKARNGGKKLLPHEVHAQQTSQTKDTEPADQDKQIKWGLSVTRKEAGEDLTDTTGGSGDVPDAQAAKRENNSSADALSPTRDENDDAMDALLGRKRKTAHDLVIEGDTERDDSPGYSEQDAYRRGMKEAAEVSTLEEYDEIPEGEFGAAMLRGMGWNGEERAPKPKALKRRANLIGLGAKEDEEIKKAEMAKKYGHKERRPRLDEYRRNKESERRSREDRHVESYKNERDRDRYSHHHGDRERNGDRDRNRDREGHRHRDRHYRR